MKKISYPQADTWRRPKKPFDIDKWNETVKKIKIAQRKYKDHSRDEVVAHYTKQWEEEEKNSFKQWLKYKETYKKGSVMDKKAAFDPYGDKESQLVEMKGKLRSRITSVERLLNKMADEGLIDGEKLLYVGRVIQKLKEEVTMLTRPQLIEACQKKANVLLKKAGLIEAVEILNKGNFKEPMIKEAQELGEAETVPEIINIIKEELDSFNYAEHLRKLMDIAMKLDKIGRHSEANDVIATIKKDLTGVDAIHKKLSDVYLTLGQIPKKKEKKEEVAPTPLPQPVPQPAVEKPPMPIPTPEPRREEPRI